MGSHGGALAVLMAAVHLSPPGSQYGPCAEACGHTDCAATRAWAETPCIECREPIGYDRRFFQDEPGKPFHMACMPEPTPRKSA